MKKPRFIAPWRRMFQWSVTLLIISIPFVRISGKSLFRVDLQTLSLRLGPLTYSIEQLYLFALFCFVLIFFFLLATLILGRIWCGWSCPQTTLVDLLEAFARQIGMQVTPARITGTGWQKLLLHLLSLVIAMLVGANIVWYFLSPYEFFPRLFSGTLGFWPTGSVITFAVIIYFDLIFIRRLLCREFCPYGRFQTVLVDAGTLTLRYLDQNDERCIHCEACVRNCPQGIDIKKGYQVECINCAKCIDACRKVMAKQGEPGLIGYTFGTAGRGWRALINPRMAFITIIAIILTLTLILVTATRTPIKFKLARIPQFASKQLADGRNATLFTAYLVNSTGRKQELMLTASGSDGKQLSLQGPVERISLAAGEKKQFNFAVLTSQHSTGMQQVITIAVRSVEDAILVENEVRLPVYREKEGSANEQ